MSAPRHRRARAAVLTAAVLATVGAGCTVEGALPPPWCEEGGAAIIVAQSVPSASQIPCLHRLPEGWAVVSVRVDQDGTLVRLDSDRAGEGAAELRLDPRCDVSGAVPAPSDVPPARRFDDIERLSPGFRARRYYVFPGGCVSWTFRFSKDASATESVAIGEALALVSREALNQSIRETFIDEEV